MPVRNDVANAISEWITNPPVQYIQFRLRGLFGEDFNTLGPISDGIRVADQASMSEILEERVAAEPSLQFRPPDTEFGLTAFFQEELTDKDWKEKMAAMK